MRWFVLVCSVLLMIAPVHGSPPRADKGKVDKELSRLNSLAYQNMFNGDHAKAETYWMRAVELAEEDGRFPLRLANLLNSLGGIRQSLGKDRSALPCLERSLKIQRERLGEVNQETIMTKKNLAYVYMELGRYREAEELFFSCLRDFKKAGEQRRTKWELLSALSQLYVAAGRYNDAECCSLKAIGEAIACKEDESVIGRQYDMLAEVYVAMKAVGLAQRTQSTAASLNSDIKSPAHRARAELCLLLGDITACEKLAQNDRAHLEPEKDRYASIYSQDLELLARVKAEQKKLPEAATLLAECLKLRETVLGPDHPLIARTLELQCRYWPEKAEALAPRIREIHKNNQANQPLGLYKRCDKAMLRLLSEIQEPSPPPSSATMPTLEKPLKGVICARVNGNPIYAEEIQQLRVTARVAIDTLPEPERTKRLQKITREILDRLIERELFVQAAEKEFRSDPAALRGQWRNALTDFEKRVDQWKSVLKKTLGQEVSDAKLRELLQIQGMTLEILRRRWERDWVATAYLERRAGVENHSARGDRRNPL